MTTISRNVAARSGLLIVAALFAACETDPTFPTFPTTPTVMEPTPSPTWRCEVTKVADRHDYRSAGRVEHEIDFHQQCSTDHTYTTVYVSAIIKAASLASIGGTSRSSNTVHLSEDNETGTVYLSWIPAPHSITGRYEWSYNWKPCARQVREGGILYRGNAGSADCNLPPFPD